MGFKIKKNIVINGYRNITFGFLGLPELLKKTFIDTTGSLLKSEKGTTKHLLVIDDNDQTVSLIGNEWHYLERRVSGIQIKDVFI